MIWINVKLTVKPEYVGNWIEGTRGYTEATRASNPSTSPRASKR